MIHETAIISPEATIGENVSIGPYCVVGENVTIGDGCILKSHVVIEGPCTIGQENIFFPFSAIGQRTQDLKYVGEPTYLVIGDRNTFRENCTIHRSTSPDTPTTIGNDNNFLAYSHVAHDCVVGSHCIFSNNGTIAGHVVVGDHAIISGFAAVHQFCRVGEHSLIGGCTKVVQDVPPFTIVDGTPAAVRSINQVGLQRRGFTDQDISFLRRAYKRVFLKKATNLTLSLADLKAADSAKNQHVKTLIKFLETTERGVIR
ncbi:acyl-[acyl-carrier-protein]--UDP-N-acetylglucosamine O-acyltransferase [Rubritalea halochordaticola]|uniref:Acyl-[acyl-carrier-protein]--UDP-N-acetylglucosamine O-acyltransferase n=1 Tax=Rubritalea halochordaticola TaxID=714537 RepID=A0ABP9UYV3_9BACT